MSEMPLLPTTPLETGVLPPPGAYQSKATSTDIVVNIRIKYMQNREDRQRYRYRFKYRGTRYGGYANTEDLCGIKALRKFNSLKIPVTPWDRDLALGVYQDQLRILRNRPALVPPLETPRFVFIDPAASLQELPHRRKRGKALLRWYARQAEREHTYRGQIDITPSKLSD